MNYRTPQNIVDLNEKFIKTHGRKIEKGNIISNKSYKGNLGYIENQSNIEEATKIVNIVKEMKRLGKINKFSDVALLFRYKYQMDYFIEELKKQEIDFHVQGISDFKEYPEVNSIMFLLWYLTKDMNNSDKTHKKIFDLKDFGNEHFDLEMFDLDEKTINLLSKVENPVEFSYYNSDELKKLGFENEHDIEFFSKLNDLKYRIHNSVDNAKLDVLKIYYELFDVTGYLERKFSKVSYDDVDENSEILNLGFLSRKIHNFMETYDRYDLDTLFEMIYDFYEDYSSPKNLFNDDDCVQLLTIHKSKGLEFPVVFLCGLKESYVPKLKRKTTKGNYDVDDEFKYHDIVKSLEKEGMYSKITLLKQIMIN